MGLNNINYSIDNSELSRMKGFIVIDIESADGKIKRHIQPNTITNIGKMAMLARSGSEILMGFGGSPYGSMECVDMLGSQENTTSGNSTLAHAKQNDGLNNYICNLDSGITLDASSKFLPVFDSNFNIDDTKLIGYANSRDVASSTKEGIQDFTKPTYMIDDICIANRWKYDAGQATGTFNHVVIAPGIHGNLKCNGMYAKKCITRINQFEDEAAFGNMFIIPGAGAITASTKILLNHTRNGVARWYYDLVTGEMTEVLATEVAYSVPMYESFDQAIYNGYLYILDLTGTIRKIDLTTGALVNSLVPGIYADCGASMYISGSNLIVMGSYNTNNGSYDARSTVVTVSTSTFTVSSTVYKINSTLIGGVPVGWASRNRIIAKKVGSYYYVNYMYEVIKCTDLTNIKGTVVASYLAHPLTHYASDGTDVWTIERGQNKINYNIMNLDKVYGLINLEKTNYYKGVWDNTTFTNLTYANNGIWVGKEWFGNILSFVKLTTPVTKAATDIMYVSYGYKFI